MRRRIIGMHGRAKLGRRRRWSEATHGGGRRKIRRRIGEMHRTKLSTCGNGEKLTRDGGYVCDGDRIQIFVWT
jgi:hypothetical protein